MNQCLSDPDSGKAIQMLEKTFKKFLAKLKQSFKAKSGPNPNPTIEFKHLSRNQKLAKLEDEFESDHYINAEDMTDPLQSSIESFVDENGTTFLDKNVDDNTEIILFESSTECSHCFRQYPIERRQVFHPCGHGACQNCSTKLKECFICNEPIDYSQKQFQ